MYNKHESDPQYHPSLDQQPGPQGADVCSDKGTCQVLGGSSGPTQRVALPGARAASLCQLS